MARFKTRAKKKLNKALRRVEKVVIMEIRRHIDQQRKWKARYRTITSRVTAATEPKKQEVGG